jgi:DNA-binding transcriptional ArsR family regulator
MQREPGIATVAALIGDTGRAAILTELMDGRAMPAGELATAAGLSAQAASAHLARLLDGGLLMVEREGRHRYYRLAGPGIATILEGLAALCEQPASQIRAHAPRSAALRFARTCYDHLAGELGVAMLDALEQRGLLAPGDGKHLEVTPEGITWFARVFTIDVVTLKPGRHGIACRCLDWTQRRHHLAGPLGTAMLRRCRDLALLTTTRPSRIVELTARGRNFARAQLGLTLPAH